MVKQKSAKPVSQRAKMFQDTLKRMQRLSDPDYTVVTKQTRKSRNLVREVSAALADPDYKMVTRSDWKGKEVFIQFASGRIVKFPVTPSGDKLQAKKGALSYTFYQTDIGKGVLGKSNMAIFPATPEVERMLHMEVFKKKIAQRAREFAERLLQLNLEYRASRFQESK